MDKRILAVLIAAMAGTAYAQSGTSGYVSNSGGNTVTNSAGNCVRNSAGNGGPCAPVTASTAAPYATSAAPRQQVAQSSGYSGSRSSAYAPAAAGATAATSPAPGYLVNSTNAPVINSARHCVHTGSWSPALAADPCDVVGRASTPPVPVAAAEPTPAPAPAEAPAPRVIEKVTLSTDVLFAFNKAELLPGGKDRLDQLAKDAQGADVERLVLAGYADRIGSEGYNKDLSERRAQAVADYLASQGVDQSRIQVEGRGEDNPVTGDQCAHMGPEKASNKKLVSCLQPDRRVEAELLGSREVAGGAAAPAGATSSGTTGTSGGGTSQ